MVEVEVADVQLGERHARAMHRRLTRLDASNVDWAALSTPGWFIATGIYVASSWLQQRSAEPASRPLPGEAR